MPEKNKRLAARLFLPYSGFVFIRKTQTKAGKKDPYFTYRLVQNVRDGQRIRQQTLLNLGTHFEIEKSDWTLLCSRILQLLKKDSPLFALQCSETVEAKAKYLVEKLTDREAQLIAKGSRIMLPKGDFEPVDVNQSETIRGRSVGVETVALWAMQTLGLGDSLERHGLNRVQRQAIIGSIVGRMADPGSERRTRTWLQKRSALGELIDFDYQQMGGNQLNRASDALVAQQEKIEADLSQKALTLFQLQPTVTLYDLTNTYFEGEAKGIPEARRGHSKEQRNDRPLLTLALVLDGSGWVWRSQVFAGNVIESKTLSPMLEDLRVPVEAPVVLDQGVATEENLQWLRQQGRTYLVVSRQRQRSFPADGSVTKVATASGHEVQLLKEERRDGEVVLYCRSEQREEKERAMHQLSAERLIKELQKWHDGLGSPGKTKTLEGVHQRIGRLKQRYSRAAQHYRIQVLPDDQKPQNAKAVTWESQPQPGFKATHPGVCCLRSNLAHWDEPQMWQTYVTLTELEAVFRSLKSELGLRPIYHQITKRAQGHLFLSVLAYQLVSTIRTRLREAKINASWDTLRAELNAHSRVTNVYRRIDGATLHMRHNLSPTPDQKQIYQTLGIEAAGSIKKTVVPVAK